MAWATGWQTGVEVLGTPRGARRRFALLADAEHELRGALTAFELGLERLPAELGLRARLASELERARAALEDLSAARTGQRARPRPEVTELQPLVAAAAAAWARPGSPVEVTGAAGAVVADGRRVAQVLGNVVSNAVEHGAGAVRVRARRLGGAVRVEVANAVEPAAAKPGRSAPRAVRSTPPAGGSAPVSRGRGLSIAHRAARDLGGRLLVVRGPAEFGAVLELPVER